MYTCAVHQARLCIATNMNIECVLARVQYIKRFPLRVLKICALARGDVVRSRSESPTVTKKNRRLTLDNQSVWYTARSVADRIIVCNSDFGDTVGTSFYRTPVNSSVKLYYTTA